MKPMKTTRPVSDLERRTALDAIETAKGYIESKGEEATIGDVRNIFSRMSSNSANGFGGELRAAHDRLRLAMLDDVDAEEGAEVVRDMLAAVADHYDDADIVRAARSQAGRNRKKTDANSSTTTGKPSAGE